MILTGNVTIHFTTESGEKCERTVDIKGVTIAAGHDCVLLSLPGESDDIECHDISFEMDYDEDPAE